MKIFKILICMMFVLVISACHDKKTIYDYPDDDPTTEKGSIGDPCEKNIDCKEGLLCIDKVCSEPVTDQDTTDDDTEPDGDEPTDDADSDTQPDEDKDTSDTEPTDDTDTGITDEDEPEDDDTQPDDDEEPYVPGCGNGIRDEGEECDNGLENSDEAGITGITCRTDCTLAKCGDGIEDSGELCDDGNLSDGDYCRSDCHGITGYCGDGIEQTNEVCDKRNNPYCSEDCQSTTGACGDGIKQSFEACDTADPSVGNHEGIGAYCTNCKEKSGRCGDGILQADIEECDDGDLLNGTYGNCNFKCNGFAPHCGDGILQRSNCNGYDNNCVVVAGANEVCDDGNIEDGDYCSSDCQTSFGSCGDGTIQDFEECDKAKPGVGNHEGIGVYCSDDCSVNYGRCGDGIIQEGIEECDYGDNGENGPVPNGNLDCTYGHYAQCERCTLECKKKNGSLRFCGDGFKQPNEACDKGDNNGKTDCAYGETECLVCLNECKKEINGNTSYCGDGAVDESNGEVCDTALDPYCSSDCRSIAGRCGDGIILEGVEECDNGETGDNPNGNKKCAYGETECKVCTTDCKITQGTEFSYCGNGGTDSANGEICDNGSNNGKYLFLSPGACNSNCKGYGEGGFCGDGTLQRASCGSFNNCSITEGANEMCDNGTDNGKTDCAYGETSCKVCSKSCTESEGKTSFCGDGIIDENNEACDDGNTVDGDYCSSDCKTQTGLCGDGIIQDNEVCDKAEPSVGDHQGIGAYCSSDCQKKTGECGDGILQEDIEDCDDGTNNGHYSHNAPGYCNSNCKGKGEGGYCGDTVKQDEEECEHGGNIQVSCAYGKKECEVCTSDCTLEAGKTTYCGDGILQREDCTGYENCFVVAGANETCDQGTNNGKYGGLCNATCSGITPYCNDGILQREDCTGYGENCVEFPGANEECDDGANNGQYLHDAPGYCNYGCKGRGNGGYCGDGTQQPGENCDDGTENGKYEKCNATCSGDSPKCGDGIIHREDCDGYGENCIEIAGSNEECDDGSNNSVYNHCNNSCSAKLTCGDGILQREDCTGYENCVEAEWANEECDDGSENGNYEKCNSTCSGYNEGGYCGDGILQKANCDGYDICDENITENCCVVTEGANEMCDSGVNNGKYSATAPGYCNEDCLSFGEGGTCNDGIIQRADCTGYDICDENITENCCVVTEGANESCDDGLDNGQNDHCNITCTAINRCGDGILQRSDCTGYAFCNVVPGADEICDDGFSNGLYENYCNETCNGYTGYCDDGILQRENCEGYDNCVVTRGGNEVCDDNIFYNGSYGHCNSECSALRTERCGDGIIHRENCEDLNNCVEIPGAAEKCDDGDNLNGTFGHCDKNCNFIINYKCGDGKVQKATEEDCAGMEICNELITENCCEVVVFSEGDGPETCDDGANNNTPDHCNSTCSGPTPYCGDGIIQRTDCTGVDNCVEVAGMEEECDESDNNGLTDCQYGQMSCSLCSASCQIISGNISYCGDGILQRDDCGDLENCITTLGIYEYCDEGADNDKYYGHCGNNCSTDIWNGYCGDGIVQMASEADCEAYVAADSENRKLCTETETTDCCKVVAFAEGDTPEICDESINITSHGHCNRTCDNFYHCGDGIVGKDEICEPGAMSQPLPCGLMNQFQYSGIIDQCNDECMPILTSCENNPSLIVQFLDTKQTLCYDNSDIITPSCPDENDDFYGQGENFVYLTQNYTVDSVTISESVSGLAWQKDTPASYSGCTTDPTSSSCTYEEAFNYCDNLDLDGYTDWRLPSAFELPAITDFAAPTHIYSEFTNTNGIYWTAEGGVFETSDGTLTQQHFMNNDAKAHVKCVRSTGSSPCHTCNNKKINILDFPDAIITIFDWTIFSFWYFEDLEETVSWQEALHKCNEVDNGIGINKMRLPTVNELITLIDPTNGKSLIPGFKGRAWTSTTLSTNTAKAYVVDFSKGNLTTDTKTNDTNNIVICVE